ncbi:MAG: Nramp family divalent metal transporter [Coriobacteriales bacterium]|nr:Nramp family divalent metal transporter [Coriobacteriales bacterium]
MAEANAGGSKFLTRLKNVGPGALVAAAFIGPGTVTTCTVSGANYGYMMLWAMLFATFATIVFQEMAARVGIISGKGLGENIRDRFASKKALMWISIILVIVAIFIGNVAYETGNITGSVMGAEAVITGNSAVHIALILIIAGLAFALLFVGKYDLVEKVLTAIVIVMGLVFVVTALASDVNWGAVIKGLFTPQMPSNDKAGIVATIGLIGTTVVPYNLFLHASSASERWKDPEQIGDARFDAILSIGLGGLISMCIIIAAAANIYGTGVTVANGKDFALALKPILGNWATWCIAIGLLAAGFTSCITAPLAAAFAVSGALGWGKDMKDMKFKAVWMIVIVCGIIMAIWLGKSPTELILTAQAANAIILPLMAFFVLYCANGADLGEFKNHIFANICGVLIIVVTLFICWKNMDAFISSVSKLIAG